MHKPKTTMQLESMCFLVNSCSIQQTKNIWLLLRALQADYFAMQWHLNGCQGTAPSEAQNGTVISCILPKI